ncbi:MAG: 30S ribosomal protein S16 [Bacteroidaceae bacterium]|nr:30S ribosomal protein S16 [Bacteroidaceae bacterium]
MATKIRLQRHGRKSYAFYSIVIADVRAPRDGKFTEKIGTYNPNTNPATVDLKFDRALYWVEVGAQPTDTVRNILSREGVYLMKHLKGGGKKGAFDEAAAQAKFEAWKADRQKGLAAVEAKLAAEKKAADAARMEAEKKANAKVQERVADKKAAEAAAKAEAEAEEAASENAEATEEATAEVAAETSESVETPAEA